MSEKRIFVFGINGSPFGEKSRVGEMLNETLASVKKYGGVPLHYTLCGVDMKPYHGEYSKRVEPTTEGLLMAMAAADAIIFATPVHWQTTSTLMKILIDNMTWLEGNHYLDGKVAGLIAHCNEDGAYQVVSQMAGTLNHMGMVIPPYCTIFRNSNIARTPETEWQFVDTDLLAKNVISMVKLLRHEDTNWDYEK